MLKPTHLPFKASPAFTFRLQNGRFLFFPQNHCLLRFKRRLEVFRSLRLHVSDENGHRKSNFSKTLLAVKICWKPFLVLACGGKITEIFENDDITVSGLKWGKNDSCTAIFLPIRLQKMLILFCSYAQVNVQISFSRICMATCTNGQG